MITILKIILLKNQNNKMIIIKITYGNFQKEEDNLMKIIYKQQWENLKKKLILNKMIFTYNKIYNQLVIYFKELIILNINIYSI